MAPHVLTRADARRIALSAQLLSADRPVGVLDTVRRLTFLQLDPTNAVAPSADLVMWSRLGAGYSPAALVDAIDRQLLVDFRGTLRPAEDMALYRAEMAQWPGTGPLRDWQVHRVQWIEANDACRLDILERLRADGPLPQRDLPDSCVEPWTSSGWNSSRNVAMLLDLMAQRGEVAVARREGRDRLWDLASRVYPDGPEIPADEARLLRDQRRLSALGIARARGPECPVEPLDVGDAGQAAVIDGVRGAWRIDPERLDDGFAGRAALLSPFDRLLHDRKRMDDVFGFDYKLEMFKPAAQRLWGYYALPILYDDRLVGKLDATADRDDRVLRVNAVHEDESFTRGMRRAVDEQIEDLAGWLGMRMVAA